MMFGFIVGTACLIGLIRVLRAPHWSGRMGWGRRGRILGRIFSRLETSPSQENVIVDAISDVRAGGRKAMPELAATRTQVAEILRAETFDPAQLESVFARHDQALAEMRALTSNAFSKVHGVLDARQRNELAALIERRGFVWGHRRGPYRSESVAV